MMFWLDPFETAFGVAFDRAEKEGDDEFISLLIAFQWYQEESGREFWEDLRTEMNQKHISITLTP